MAIHICVFTAFSLVPKKFFNWAYANGGKAAVDLDYVPMPPEVVAAIQKSWGDIKDASGKAVAFK